VSVNWNPLDAALAVVNAQPNQGLQESRIRALLCGYDHRWAIEEDLYQIEAVERLLQAPLVNPETKRDSRTFTIAGMLDVELIAKNGEHGIMDHKTTSDSIDDPNGDYWRQLVVEAQPNHYLWLKHLNGERATWAIWDVVKKPQTKPSKLTKAEMKQLAETGIWYGFKMDPAEVSAALKDERETFALYEARLVDDCTMQRPASYFQRRRYQRLDAEIYEFATELWDLGQEFVQIRQTGRHVRNSNACMLYNRACTYLPLCSGHDTMDSERWTRKQFVHNELPIIDDGQDGRSILTNSRIKTFQTCRRMQQLSYEVGIERFDEEESAALAFGTLWHKALAAYFNTIKENQNGNTCLTNATEARRDAATVGV
jgi:hypothetical protein